MNLDRLEEAEAGFLQLYPGGFADPAMQGLRKKHNVNKLVEFAQAHLTRADFNQPGAIADTLLKIVSRSSMVSRFEKPPFRSFLDALGAEERQALASAFEHRLHRRGRRGFDEIVAMLSRHKIAKWAVVSAVPFYFAPTREVFIKPTTTKRILAALEITDLRYHPTPSWEFYNTYRDLVAEIKRHVDPSLAPNNAALSGFLMMVL